MYHSSMNTVSCYFDLKTQNEKQALYHTYQLKHEISRDVQGLH